MLLTWRATVFSLITSCRRSLGSCFRWRRGRAPRPLARSSHPAPAALCSRTLAAATSGAAPRPANACRAASSSIAAVSSSPTSRQTSPIRNLVRADSYGASTSCHDDHAWRSARNAAHGSPSARSTMPAASFDIAGDHRRGAQLVGQSAEARRPRRGRPRHRRRRAGSRRERRAAAPAGQGTAARRVPARSPPPPTDSTLAQAQQGEAGLRAVPGVAGPPVRVAGRASSPRSRYSSACS